MTEAQVRAVITSAAEHGRELSNFDASMFLMCKEFVARGPGEHFENASKVLADYARYMTTGIRSESFTMFLLPCPKTAEEIAHTDE